MNRFNTLKLALAAALGALAVLALPAAAAAKDRNHDRIPDRWEKRHHLSLTVNQAGRDQDGDQLRNRAEFLAGDNPRNPDSDNNGVMDGEENAGTIQSFDPATGRLVVALFGGETASGLVTAGTEIECHGEHSATASDSHPDESESGDEHPGPEGGEGEGAEGEPGDDGGDHGEEADSHGGEGDEAGDDDHGSSPGEGGGEPPSCTTADLTEGAVVREAELKIENGAATFEKVELAG